MPVKTSFLKITDQDQRELIESRLDDNLIVLAGAGTGKTTLLIRRLMALILGKQIPVEKIVALTFTKKAAEEMRERLEDQLRLVDATSEFCEKLWKQYPEAKAHLQKNIEAALNDIPKAQIGTIHSFAGTLLRLYPIQAGVDPKFREDEGDQFRTFFEMEWKAWLASELGATSPSAKNWQTILLEIPIEDIQQLAQELCSPFFEFGSTAPNVDLKKLAKAALSKLQDCQSKGPASERAKTFNEGLKALTEALETVAQGKPVTEDIKEMVRRFPADKPPKGWESQKENLKEIKKQTKALMDVRDDLIEKAMNLVGPFVQQFRNLLRQKGVVSFDGLLVLARNLLQNHPTVREDIKKKYETFLVDEFQDTDPYQGEILFYLAEEPQAQANQWDSVKLGKGRLFVVGDPKQSIYRFRGADMAAFQLFRDKMAEQGALESTLSNNFRSGKDIIDAVNQIFEPSIVPEPFIQPAYVPLQPTNDDPEKGQVNMTFLQARTDKKEAADVLRRSEATWIADWIHEHVGKPWKDRVLRYEDCALLFRSTNAFEEYLMALKGKGIPYLAEGEKFFFQTVEVSEFMNILSAIAQPEDRLSLVGVLRSPLAGLSDRDIFEAKKKDHLNYRLPTKKLDGKLKTIFTLLNDLHQKSQELSASDIINEVLQKTWISEILGQSIHGEQALANIAKIKNLADNWSSERPLSLPSFVQKFNSYREDQKEEGENPLADVQYDAVKVMTIHKAKGLEFPVVFLPNLSASRAMDLSKPAFSRDWRTQLVGLRLVKTGVTNSAMVSIEKDTQKRDRAEEVRVFYVAATRAKDRIFYMVRENPSRTSEFSNVLQKGGMWPAANQSVISQADTQFPVTRLMIQNDEGPFRSPAKRESLGQSWNEQKLQERIKKQRQEYAQLQEAARLTSPSMEMNRGDAEVESEGERFEPPDEEGVSFRSKAIKIGLVCHRVLEEWDFSVPISKGKEILKDKVFQSAKLFELVPGTPSDDPILEESRGILHGFLTSSLGKKLGGVDIKGREIPFLFPRSRQMVRGVIDLVYAEKNQLIIADYKTNKLPSSEVKPLVEHYRVQAEIYKEAIAKTTGQKAQFELLFLREKRSIRI